MDGAQKALGNLTRKANEHIINVVIMSSLSPEKQEAQSGCLRELMLLFLLLIISVTQEAAKAELIVENMKLIHLGKVLRDEQKLEECNLKPTNFLICMITKAKKAAAQVSVAAVVADVTPPNAINAKSTSAVAATANWTTPTGSFGTN